MNKKQKSRYTPWLQKPHELGVYDTLLLELRFREEQEYKNILRMTSDNVDEILSLIEIIFVVYFYIQYTIFIRLCRLSV